MTVSLSVQISGKLYHAVSLWVLRTVYFAHNSQYLMRTGFCHISYAIMDWIATSYKGGEGNVIAVMCLSFCLSACKTKKNYTLYSGHIFTEGRGSAYRLVILKYDHNHQLSIGLVFVFFCNINMYKLNLQFTKLIPTQP